MSSWDELACRQNALGGIAFVITRDQLDLLSEKAPFRVDFIDRQREPSRDGFARLRRRTSANR